MPKKKNFSTPSIEELEEQDAIEQIQEEASQGLVPLEESAALNKLLLRNARQPLSVISKLTGIPVDEVAERLVVLLDNPSWRDDLMEEKLLLREMTMLLEEIRTRMSRTNVDDESWMQGARIQLAVIKTMLEQLAARRKALDGQMSALTLEEARVFAEAIKLNNQLTTQALAAKYDIEVEEVYAVWEENFPRALEMLEGRASG